MGKDSTMLFAISVEEAALILLLKQHQVGTTYLSELAGKNDSNTSTKLNRLMHDGFVYKTGRRGVWCLTELGHKLYDFIEYVLQVSPSLGGGENV